MNTNTSLTLLVCLALLFTDGLHAKSITSSSDDITAQSDLLSAHHREKRWFGAVIGAIARIGAGAARVGAGAGRLGAGAANSAARAGLGAARIGSQVGSGVVRTGGQIGQGVVRTGANAGRVGARQIANLANSGVKFVARNPKRIAAEVMLLGGSIGLNHALAPAAPTQMPEYPPGQNYAVECSQGWTHLDSNGQCYVKAPESLIYHAARDLCYNAYASLAMPRSLAQVAKVVEVVNSTESAWIGLNDIDAEGDFQWADKKRLNEVNWAHWELGHPVVGKVSEYEDCVLAKPGEGRWEATYCVQAKPFVCQTPEIRAFDVFKTGVYEWELVFRGTPGVIGAEGSPQSVYEAFITQQTVAVEPGCRQVKTSEECTHHYRNNFAIDTWSYIDEVALVLYKNGEAAAFVVFDGADTTATSWMDTTRVKRTSFTDLMSSTKNIFSLQGEDTNGRERRFFINHRSGGCGLEEGWVAVVGGPGCEWENRNVSYPRFLYAEGNSKSNWSAGQVAEADVLAVFVKYAVPTQ